MYYLDVLRGREDAEYLLSVKRADVQSTRDLPLRTEETGPMAIHGRRMECGGTKRSLLLLVSFIGGPAMIRASLLASGCHSEPRAATCPGGDRTVDCQCRRRARPDTAAVHHLYWRRRVQHGPGTLSNGRPHAVALNSTRDREKEEGGRSKHRR